MAKHRVLVVGVGSIGERHVRTFQATGRAEISIVEISERLRQTIGDRYGLVRRYGSLDEALNDEQADHTIGVIAAPAHLHIDMARQIVEAGLHPFIEKPLSTSLEGTTELIEQIQRQAVVAAVAYTYRSHPTLRSMREAIRSGRFGRPVQVVSAWGQHFPKYRPAYRQIYYARHETGGGAIQDVMTHAINAGEFLAGNVDRLMADAAHQVIEGVTVEDTVHVITRQGGVMGCYSLNQHQAPNEGFITVVCEKGTAQFKLHQARWLSMTKPDTPWQEEFRFSMERDDTFIHQANLYLDAVEGKGEVACTVAEALQTLRVNLAVLKAADSPGWVQIG